MLTICYYNVGSYKYMIYFSQIIFSEGADREIKVERPWMNVKHHREQWSYDENLSIQLHSTNDTFSWSLDTSWTTEYGRFVMKDNWI